MGGGPGGPRAASALWSRQVVRRRWPSIVALGLLAAAGLAVSMAALAGARRSETAYARLRDATAAADAVVFASQVGIFDPDWSAVADLPYVAAAGAFGLPDGVWVAGPDGVPLDHVGFFDTSFGDWRAEVDRPVLLAGRQPDPHHPDEVLASAEAGRLGVRVGDELVARLNTPAQSAAFGNGDPQGPYVTLTVVGIGKSTFESAVIAAGPTIFGTPAFDERYGDGITGVSNLLVRFEPGQRDLARLERDARAIFDSDTLPVLDAGAVGKRVTNGTGLEADGLTLFAAAVAAAALALVGQALSRAVRSGGDDAATLRVLGMTRRDAAIALVRPFAATLAIAAIVGVAGAVALSPRFPIGLAREIEPDIGVHADVVVLALGTVVGVVVLAAVAGVSAWREAGRAVRPGRGRSSVVVTTLTRAGAPVPMTVGARLALEPGSGQRALPTRPAFVGAVVGVLGVIGGVTLAAGIDDAVSNPARVGSFWHIEASWYDPSVPPPAAIADLPDDPDVLDAANAWRDLVLIDGTTLPTYALDVQRGTFEFVVMAGRAPSRPGEIALGPATAREYGIGLGDVVDAGAGQSSVPLEVVGLALLPQTPHSGYDQGAWVTTAQLEELHPGLLDTAPPTMLAELGSGVDVDAKIAEVAAALPTGQGDVRPPELPGDLRNLANVRSLPLLFAAFTLLLAIGTMAHVSTSVLRRRRRELAVLRSLGMTPHQTRAAMSWQATTLAVIGLCIGLPVGLAVGRATWRWIADATPMVYVAPIAVVVTVAAIPVALVIGNLLALWPGRRAAADDPSAALRTE